MGDYKTRSVAMLFKSYISTSLLSSLFVACTFTLFSDGGFRGVYWFIFGLTFFISLPLNLLFLFFAIKINMKFGGAFAFVFVFFMGFASVSAVIYFLLQRIPGMDVISLFYGFFGAGAGVVSMVLYWVLDGFFRRRLLS
ncbi:hypothetical protein [Paracidovorax avenae]|uniref:hypothetical protein n=1 Tax=Paracidovorax avenae TaxID=80867 RepID=UPI00126035DF|nr:hypothetical protein [Paracidovorax avenae]